MDRFRSELGGCVWEGGIIVNNLGLPIGHGATGPGQEWEGYETSIALAPKITEDVPLYDEQGTGIMQKWYSISSGSAGLAG